LRVIVQSQARKLDWESSRRKSETWEKTAMNTS